jgi:hypothetical protein
VTEANRRRESGTREYISLRRINLECNTYVHGTNARNFHVWLSLFSEQKPFVLLIIVYTLSSTKLNIKAEQVLPGSEGVGMRGSGWGERDSSGGRGEK